MPPYAGFLAEPLVNALWEAAEPVPGVNGLRVANGLQAAFPTLEHADVHRAVLEVYAVVADQLEAVLEQRRKDRAFVDEYALAAHARNVGKSVKDADYDTVIGKTDADGRVVVGPASGPRLGGCDARVTVYEPQITLFGPPESARLAVNAMNALHRKSTNEPAIVAELVEHSGTTPRWGADSEDSQTPIARDLLSASINLGKCFDGTLSFVDPKSGRESTITQNQPSLPIKRVAGLALPDGNHLFEGQPLPLHLVEFVQHAWLNRAGTYPLHYYLPKLENEEEARYIRSLVYAVERAVRNSSWEGKVRVRLLLVFENPRAIFRIVEMASALYPYFKGGSLGWHDFLASTARLFKNDPGYRIPVKADASIVVRHIRESHRILVADLTSMQALRIGGMYGVLPTPGDEASQIVSLVGFFRDVTTQLKRGLEGFWVAHPDFVRIGIAIEHAWRLDEDKAGKTTESLIRALITDPTEIEPLLAFVRAPDAPGLSPDDPRYLRSVLAADIGVSDVIANDHPDEIRYNVFQALQYLAAWLGGNGCVALPATMKSASGKLVFVRVMDDLATTERSRWELWAEVAHGRVGPSLFEAILSEEVEFIRSGAATEIKRTQVAWAGQAERWYPIAVRLLRQLVLCKEPPEFVTELLLPFTYELVRNDPDPWAVVTRLCPGRYVE